MSAREAGNSGEAEARARIDWRSLTEVVPAGLELMPMTTIMRQAFELVGNAADAHGFVAASGVTQARLREARIPLQIRERSAEQGVLPPTELSQSQRRWLGQLALGLYFVQLFRSDTALVDLWPSRWGIDATGDAVWAPRPLYVRWDPVFLNAVRDVYSGYFGDDDPSFRSGLERLRLGAAGEVLLRHLGGGHQRSVRFRANDLQTTLREIVSHRPSHANGLHRNFVPFGLYLASLHELLASLDLAFDVRGAFMRATAAR